MRRREFISMLVGTAAGWPLAAPAQQTSKPRKIGVLGTSTAKAWSRWTPAFVQRLRELGWIENRTITIEYLWAEGHKERYTDIVAEFVRRKADVIVTGEAALPTAKRATSTIPIVFALASDPVGSGLVASFSRPGANVTGLSAQSTDLAGKRLGLLREVVPGLRRLAIMANAGYPSAGLQVREIRNTARALGIDVAIHDIRRGDEITPAFEVLKGHAEALFVPADPLVNANRVRIAALARNSRLATIFGLREYVEAGGLLSDGANIPDLFRRAGDLVDKILRGARAADLPVEQPTKFDLAINLITAKAIGLTVPPALLARAHVVIE